MTAPHSDALVLFGATGDLAHKMIFPALYAMVKRGALKVPIIGVAFPKWIFAQLHDRVRDSVTRSGGIDDRTRFDQLLSLLGYVSGDYKDPQTLQEDQGCAGSSPSAGTLSRHPARALRDSDHGAGRRGPGRAMRGSSSKSRSAATWPRRGS